jgi:hypothetical protein
MIGTSPLDYWSHPPFPDSSQSSMEKGFSSWSGLAAWPLNVYEVGKPEGDSNVPGKSVSAAPRYVRARLGPWVLLAHENSKCQAFFTPTDSQWPHGL